MFGYTWLRLLDPGLVAFRLLRLHNRVSHGRGGGRGDGRDALGGWRGDGGGRVAK